MFEDLLHTITQVAVTMAGFSGVVYALGNRTGRKLSVREKSGVLHMLLPSFGAVMFPLISISLLNSELSNPVAWRISCGIAGLYVIIGASRSTLDMLRGENSLPLLLAWPLNITGEIIGVVNVLIALGMFRGYADIACISIFIFMLFVSMVSFSSLLTEEHEAS